MEIESRASHPPPTGIKDQSGRGEVEAEDRSSYMCVFVLFVLRNTAGPSGMPIGLVGPDVKVFVKESRKMSSVFSVD